MQTLAYFLIWGAFFFFMMRFGCGATSWGTAIAMAAQVQ